VADELAPGAQALTLAGDQHSIVYVAGGAAMVNGVALENDSATYVEGSLQITAGANGAGA
jgi:hypothetical protein